MLKQFLSDCGELETRVMGQTLRIGRVKNAAVLDEAIPEADDGRQHLRDVPALRRRGRGNRMGPFVRIRSATAVDEILAGSDTT